MSTSPNILCQTGNDIINYESKVDTVVNFSDEWNLEIDHGSILTSYLESLATSHSAETIHHKHQTED